MSLKRACELLALLCHFQSLPGKSFHEVDPEATEVDHPLGTEEEEERTSLIASPVACLCVADMLNAGMSLLPEKLRRNLSVVVVRGAALPKQQALQG